MRSEDNVKTKATVIQINGTRAIVESERVSACEGCHKATEEGGCSVCSLMGPNRKIQTQAYNPLGAKVGDVVTIESETGRMLAYAALVFIFPLVMALTFFAVTSIWTEAVLWQCVAAGIGFIFSFVTVFFYSSAVQKKRCDVRITEILKTGTEQ